MRTQGHDIEAAMVGKVTALRARLLSLSSMTVPSLDDVAAIVTLLRGAERRGAVVSAACDLAVSLCDRGDVATDVKTRDVLSRGGVVPVLMALIYLMYPVAPLGLIISVALPLMLLAGHLMHHTVERPSLRLGRALSQQLQGAQTP